MGADGDPRDKPNWLRAAGMAVHAFTASGALCALLALQATLESRFEVAFGWLLLALAIDAVDGTLARAVNIETTVPRFSGERLDLVVDYLNYVFVPVLLLLEAGFLPGSLGWGLAAAVLLSSLYHFADTESKADDNSFVGFPAVWNLVAFFLLAFAVPSWGAMLLTALLCALAFVPMRWPHPLRVRRHAVLNVGMMTVGLGAAVWILVAGFPGPILARIGVGLATAYFVAMAIVAPRGASDG
jgi:phosphatidylcholine synthase